MKYVLLLVALVITGGLSGQSTVNFGRPTGKNKLVALQPIRVDSLRSAIYASVSAANKKQLGDRNAMKFAQQSTNAITTIFQNGSVYADWPEATAYLNQVKNRLLADHPEYQTNIRAYLLKQGQPNAFMTASGQFFINVGLLSELSSESELAGVIAHEIAHFTLDHGIDGFVKEEAGDFDQRLFYNAKRAASKFSIANEIGADERAIGYLLEAGYDLDGLLSVLDRFERQEVQTLLKYRDEWELKETTHPSSARRIRLIRERAEEQQPGSRPPVADFLEKNRDDLRAETLKFLLQESDYADCLELAFRYHLYAPQNATYLYYLMESIRRSSYLDVEQWSRNFIVDRYYEVDSSGPTKKKVDISSDFFAVFRPELLGMSPADLDQLPTKFYWTESAKFTSYEQAYQFFYQISKLIGEPECELSNALSLSFNPELRDQGLKKYLEFDGIRYRKYAQALLDNKIYAKETGKKLTVLHRFIPVIRQSSDRVVLSNWTGTKQLNDNIATLVAEDANREYLYLPDLLGGDSDQFGILNSLEQFSSTILVTRGDRPELHILNPEWWMVFRSYQVSEIEFLNFVYDDKVKNAFDLESYRNVAFSQLDDYLKETGRRGNYLGVFITAVRLSPDKDMKSRFYSGGNRLSVKLDGYEGITEVLKGKLEEIDKE